jgi:purine-cytosine permease-like protein
MYDQTRHQQSTGVMAPSAARGTLTAFGARHVKRVAVSRWIAALCFAIAAAVLMALGYWQGALFFLPAALNGSLAYLVPRWNLRRDIGNSVDLPA